MTSYGSFTRWSLVCSLSALLAASAGAQDAAPQADEAPADEAPADEAPADEAPADEAPADEAPADEAPADEAPADEAPADDDGSAGGTERPHGAREDEADRLVGTIGTDDDAGGLTGASNAVTGDAGGSLGPGGGPYNAAGVGGPAFASAAHGDGQEGDYPNVSGGVFFRSRTRLTHRGVDQDFFAGLALDVDLARGVDFHLSGDVFLNGWDDSTRRNLLADSWDTWDGDVQGRLYEASVRTVGRGLAGLELRVGRQLHRQPRQLNFDGIWAAYRFGEHVRVRGLAGVPVLFYESSRRGDVIAGGGVDVSPTSYTSVSFDYVHVTTSGQRRAGFAHDDLFTLSLNQRVGDHARVFARGEVLDDEANSAEAGLTVGVPEAGVRVTARYYVLFDRKDDMTTPLDPFSPFMGALQPYQLVDVSLWKEVVGDLLAVEGFYSFRDVRHDDREGLYNRDYHRYGASLLLSDWPLPGVGVTLTAARWDVVDHGGTDTTEVSGEVRYAVTDALTLGAGSSYYLYRYDEQLLGLGPQVTTRLREDVRTYFVNARLTFGGSRVDVGYEYEDADLGDFQVIRVGYRHDF